jgi:hypothetical protein
VIRWLTGACGLLVWHEPARYARKSRQVWGSTVVGAAGMAVEAHAADVGLAARAVVVKAAVSCATRIGSPSVAVRCGQQRQHRSRVRGGGWQHRRCWWHRSSPPPHPRIHAAATVPNVCRTAPGSHLRGRGLRRSCCHGRYLIHRLTGRCAAEYTLKSLKVLSRCRLRLRDAFCPVVMSAEAGRNRNIAGRGGRARSRPDRPSERSAPQLPPPWF